MFSLNIGTYKPYKKHSLLYIKKSLNHPPQMKQLPRIIRDRLSKNSSNEEVFNESKGEYEHTVK